jgi:hypothetical protein
MKFLLLLLLASCNQTGREEELSTLQKKYLASLDLEGAVFMESCLDGSERNYVFYHCQEKYFNRNRPTQQSNGNSIMKTAAGVALGYGAVKVLTGK